MGRITKSCSADAAATQLGEAQIAAGAGGNMNMVTWLYGSVPAADGTVIRGAWPGGPSWALCGAEVLGEDY